LREQLKGRRTYFGSWIQRVQSMVVLMYLGRTSWWQEYMAEEVFHLMVDRKQSGGGGKARTRYNSQRYTPSDQLPPARPYFLKFLPSPPNSATIWGLSIQHINLINHINLWGPFHIQTIIVKIKCLVCFLTDLHPSLSLISDQEILLKSWFLDLFPDFQRLY
jgi:hypothetical protein